MPSGINFVIFFKGSYCLSASARSTWLFRQFKYLFLMTSWILNAFIDYLCTAFEKQLNVNLRDLRLSDFQIIARFGLIIFTYARIGASTRKFLESRQESYKRATFA